MFEEGGFDLHTHSAVDNLTSLQAYENLIKGIKHSPEEAVIKAKEVGLDGIALTNHDDFDYKTIDKFLDAAAKYGLIGVPGIEITSMSGLYFPHILAIGVDPGVVTKSKYRIPSLQKPGIVIDWINDHGGVAIAAHPIHDRLMRDPTLVATSFTHEQVEALVHKLDGIEVQNPGIDPYPASEEPDARLVAMARKYDKATLASSDAHRLTDIGIVRTKIYRTVSTWEDVREAIRDRQTDPFHLVRIPGESGYLLNDRHPQLLLQAYVRD